MEIQSLKRIIEALNGSGTKYLIVGGLAVIAYGYERLTRDVDIVIGLEDENIRRGLHALLSIGYQMSIPVTVEEFADALHREKWRRDKNMIVLRLWSELHRRTPIDVFVYEPFHFTTEFESATWEELPGSLKIPVVSYPTLIAMKRNAGRDKDLLDIQSLEKIDNFR